MLGILTVSSDRTTVLGTALDGTTPAHGMMALGCAQSRDLLAVDRDVLDVLLGGVVVLVCWYLLVWFYSHKLRCLTVHGDAVTLASRRRVLILNGHLRVLSSLD